MVFEEDETAPCTENNLFDGLYIISLSQVVPLEFVIVEHFELLYEPLSFCEPRRALSSYVLHLDFKYE